MRPPHRAANVCKLSAGVVGSGEVLGSHVGVDREGVEPRSYITCPPIVAVKEVAYEVVYEGNGAGVWRAAELV